MGRIIFHIDVNSAYLSWTAVEQLKNGAKTDLRDIPSIIGGDKTTRHGVVLAKSVPAKKYGIRTGEPVVNALRKCPGLKMVPPDHDLYTLYSERMMNFLKEYTPDLEQVSVDECFMDFTGIAHQFASPLEASLTIKDGIYRQFGFTVNIGISSNKLLAKMASDFEKPNRIHTLFPEEIRVKMWPLPVRELFMAGRSSVEVLNKLEIRTIGELAQADPKLLELHLKSHGRTLWEFANGIGETALNAREVENKGIGNSTTLAKDAETLEDAREVLLWLAEKVGQRLRIEKQKARMISVEIRYADFRNVSHQMQLTRATQITARIYETACLLFDELWSGEPVRLLGIRTARLLDEDEPEQMNLFDMQIGQPKDEKQQKLERALDEIKEKYGKDAVKRGSLL